MTKYLLISLFLLVLVGCSVGRGPGGEIVIGMEVGRMVETGNQAIIAAAGMVPGIGGILQTLLIGGGTMGLTVAGGSKLLLNRIETRRRKADQSREATQLALARVEAQLEAAEDKLEELTKVE